MTKAPFSFVSVKIMILSNGGMRHSGPSEPVVRAIEDLDIVFH